MSTWVIGLRAKLKVMAFISLNWGKNTKDSSLIFSNTAKEKSSSRMETSMRENFKEESQRDLGFIPGKMELCTKDSSNKALERVKALLKREIWSTLGLLLEKKLREKVD